jgi:hypothetical protein
METTRQITESELKTFIDSIKKTMSDKKINATGKTSNSLRSEVQESDNKVKGTVYGDEVLEFLNTGRGDGGIPPFDNIIKWVKDKPISSGEDADSVGVRVALKISNEGTEIFKDNSKGIELSKKVETLRSNLNQKLPNAIKLDVEQGLDKFIKAHFNNI